MEVQASANFYKNVKCSKFPMDAWSFQEIIFKHEPTVIIEIGNLHGGSAWMLRDWLMDTKDGRCVIAIDINHEKLDDRVRQVENIFWIEGDAKSEEVVKTAKQLILPEDRVMVIDDSEHTIEHTYGVLKAYADFVTPGQFFIVEDTILGNMLPRAHGEFGADVAVRAFLKERDDFEVITYWQKWFLTLNPGGYLQKKEIGNEGS